MFKAFVTNFCATLAVFKQFLVWSFAVQETLLYQASFGKDAVNALFCFRANIREYSKQRHIYTALVNHVHLVGLPCDLRQGLSKNSRIIFFPLCTSWHVSSRAYGVSLFWEYCQRVWSPLTNSKFSTWPPRMTFRYRIRKTSLARVSPKMC